MFAQRVLLILVVILTTAAVCSAADDDIILGNEKSRMIFTRNGVLKSIYDASTVKVIAGASKDQPAWTASTIKSADGGEFSSLDYPAPQVSSNRNYVQFKWAENGKATITCTARFQESDSSFRLKIHVDNSNPYAIGSLTWPAQIVFRAKSSDYAIYNDTLFDSSIKPLDKIGNDFVVYPGHLFMQMAGFKIGNTALLVHSTDTSVYPKAMRFEGKDGVVYYKFMHLLRIRAGEKRDIPYELVFRMFPNGDYHDIAAGYAQWARKQHWADTNFTKKLAARPALEKYMQNGFIRLHSTGDKFERVKDGVRKSIYSQPPTTIEDGPLVYNGPQDYNHAQQVVDLMTRYREQLGIEPGLWDPVWHGKFFDSTYPDYLPIPSYMGDFQWFRKQITENKWPVMYHLNLVHWSKDAPSYSREKMIMFNGNYLDNMTGWTWFNLAGGWTSPGLTYPTDRKTIQYLADKAGYNGVYLDEIGHAFAEDENPASPYTKTDAGYQRAQLDIFKDVRKIIKGPIMTEGGNELWLPYCDLFYGTVGGPESDYVPMFDMVYGDCIIKLTGFDASAFNRTFQNHTWMIGGIIGTQGEDADLYEVVNKQRVVANMTGTRLLRFDRIDNTRVSNWKNGTVIWNKPGSTPKDAEYQTSLGKIAIKGANPDSCVILARNGEFSAEGVTSVTVNGKLIYTTSDATLSCSCANGRYVFRNIYDVSKKYEVYIKCGKNIPSTKALSAIDRSERPIASNREKDGCRVNVEVPAKDAAVVSGSD